MLRIKIMAILVAILVMFTSHGFAYDIGDYGLSSDPKLEKPKEDFEKALYYMAKGDRHYRGKPGHAMKMYEHAEDYFLKAEFLYKQIGQDEGIDVSHEISESKRMYRGAHVLFGEVRTKANW